MIISKILKVHQNNLQTALRFQGAKRSISILHIVNTDVADTLPALREIDQSNLFDLHVLRVFGEDAVIQYVLQQSYDVVLFETCGDHNVMLETLSVLKDNTPSLPVILLTNSDDQYMHQNAYEHGVDFCLTKDAFNSSMLDSVIQAALHNRKKMIELKDHDSQTSVKLAESIRVTTTLAHEVGTLASAYKSATELRAMEQVTSLKSGDKSPKQDDKYSSLITGYVDQLHATTQSVLANAGMADQPPTKGKESLISISERVRRLATPIVNKSNKALSIIEPHEDAAVSTEAVVLIQIAINLISNAAKYSDPNSKIGFSLLSNETSLCMMVSNSGSGMPKDVLHNLRTRGKRGSNTASQSGHGLGLSIVDDFIKQINGKLIIESGPEKGTYMQVIIPLTQA